jgi:hypothetical protein
MASNINGMESLYSYDRFVGRKVDIGFDKDQVEFVWYRQIKEDMSRLLPEDQDKFGRIQKIYDESVKRPSHYNGNGRPRGHGSIVEARAQRYGSAGSNESDPTASTKAVFGRGRVQHYGTAKPAKTAAKSEHDTRAARAETMPATPSRLAQYGAAAEQPSGSAGPASKAAKVLGVSNPELPPARPARAGSAAAQSRKERPVFENPVFEKNDKPINELL